MARREGFWGNVYFGTVIRSGDDWKFVIFQCYVIRPKTRAILISGWKLIFQNNRNVLEFKKFQFQDG